MLTPCIPSVNVPGSEGYAMRVIDGVRQYEHVAAWVAVNGPVPEGKVLDHLCHDPAVCHERKRCPHRRCRNAEHLTPVTRGENVSRERADKPPLVEECHLGHPYDALNTYVDPGGRRHCRTCRARWFREHRERKRHAA